MWYVWLFCCDVIKIDLSWRCFFGYGKITKYEIEQHRILLEEKIYNAIRSINNSVVEGKRLTFGLKELSCIGESFNFGLDVYIESSATIKYTAFDLDSLEEVRSGNIRLTDESCYGVGYCKNVFDSVNDIFEAIISEVEDMLSYNDEYDGYEEELCCL